MVECFSYYEGVPRRVIFDNAKVAVKEGFGANARATDSYSALAAHYGFTPVFCNVASGNEKGLVEGLVGYARRNFLVPVPRIESMDELNAMLKARCEKYLNHRIQGKAATVGELLRAEKKVLYSLPPYRFDPARRAESKVNPGGYHTYPQALEQFTVSDERTAAEINRRLKELGREPVWKDWDASFDLFGKHAG